MDSAISHGKQKEQFGGTEPHVDNDTESIAAKQLHIGSSCVRFATKAVISLVGCIDSNRWAASFVNDAHALLELSLTKIDGCIKQLQSLVSFYESYSQKRKAEEASED